MKTPNPYAPPDLVDEELSKTVVPVPQSFRQALLQGLKLGFKWGNRIGLALCSLNVIFVLFIWVYRFAVSKNPGSFLISKYWWQLLKFIGMSVGLYFHFCIMSIIIATLICVIVYFLRKASNRLRRR